MKTHYKVFVISIICTIATSCKSHSKVEMKEAEVLSFNDSSLHIKEVASTKKIHGQVLYLPVYSSVPYLDNNKKFDLSAFVSVHNTDLKQNICITRVLFFNNDGKLVENYLSNDSILKPLGATNFFVPEHDQSGTGANFLIEWAADSAVNEPLIESVMISLTHGQGVSFASSGKIIRELK